ncbi:MAG: hypothetical protein M3Q56_01285, partial [Bacteroidota bacterium]|nr:hypothetical protein [Bacteroidota bacterium]
VCCEQSGECKISDLKIKRTDCNEEKEFYIYLKFNHKGTSDCFRVKGNGHNYGEFKYSQLPVKLGPFKGDCTTEYEFVVIDCKNEHCGAEINLGKVCCEQSGECKISDLKIERTDCNEEKEFYIYLKFNHKGTSDCFRVKGNGQNYGEFKYSQLPVKLGPFKGDCKTAYEFVVIDCKNERCLEDIQLGKVCCEHRANCEITELKATPLHCTGPGKYSLKIDFNHVGTTNTYFDLFDRNGHIGYYKFSDLPLTIADFSQSGREHDLIKVCENDNPKCCAVIEFKGPTCLTSQKEASLDQIKIHISSGKIVLSSQQEMPEKLDIKMYELTGKQVPINGMERSFYEVTMDQPLFSGMLIIELKSDQKHRQAKLISIRTN